VVVLIDMQKPDVVIKTNKNSQSKAESELGQAGVGWGGFHGYIPRYFSFIQYTAIIFHCFICSLFKFNYLLTYLNTAVFAHTIITA
jgi:hypothetical protein